MSFASVLERITATQQERRREALASYYAVVKVIGNDEEPDAEYVQGVLHAAGKSVDDLVADVQLYKRRVELRRLIDNAESAKEQQRQLQEQRSEAEREFAPARERFQAKISAIEAAQHGLQQTILYEESARSQLKDSCRDQLVLEELREAQRKAQECGRQYAEMETRKHDLELQLHRWQAILSNDTGANSSHSQHYKNEEAKAREQFDEHEKQMRQLYSKIEECNAAVDSILAKTLEP